MNTPTNSHLESSEHPTQNPRLWAQRNAHAAAQLSPNFADNVLRSARLERTATASQSAPSSLWRFFHNPFALSGLTACACFAAVVYYHTQSVNQTNEENIADWRNLAAQVDSLDPL